ncbi:MAG: nucleotidyltransferase [Lachnospiraceae bacterium]|nr:nucleotidyltransferase [Lachnospiraceae bacterium]
MTLIIMAAGMGSRYGGLKQLDPLGPGGEFLLDYSIYDAVKAGFNKVVFVIKKENLELFRETVGERIEKAVKVEYAFQDIEDIPENGSIPEGRVKPWGTAHAVYCCRKLVDEPFAVINSDDFYGAEAFECLAKYLSQNGADNTGIKADGAVPHRYCMAAYMLKNTLTENGSVSRGVCLDKDMNLTSITEHTKIERLSDGRLINTEDDGTQKELNENLHVSMNCWGFTPEFFNTLEKGLKTFFDVNKGEKLNKAEYYLLTAVQDEIDAGTATVKLLETDAKWFGVTYKEDRPKVVEAIRKLIAEGVYPGKLWA